MIMLLGPVASPLAVVLSPAIVFGITPAVPSARALILARALATLSAYRLDVPPPGAALLARLAAALHITPPGRAARAVPLLTIIPSSALFHDRLIPAVVPRLLAPAAVCGSITPLSLPLTPLPLATLTILTLARLPAAPFAVPVIVATAVAPFAALLVAPMSVTVALKDSRDRRDSRLSPPASTAVASSLVMLPSSVAGLRGGGLGGGGGAGAVIPGGPIPGIPPIKGDGIPGGIPGGIGGIPGIPIIPIGNGIMPP
eukprot:CAMPEP_0177765850 /NCGR_PEP_ID=MMETSP0491_2-20121128/8206_1 /TAXON_ID=63592 /ORGANISM="Tetraselmis chuii, Strain PLY429" /LENGTH=256 /DNA_ID=CAMNT_0019282215 /DNA_START=3791 /DNA_END=4559 /DNA_ORIENTATION=-